MTEIIKQIIKVKRIKFVYVHTERIHETPLLSLSDMEMPMHSCFFLGHSADSVSSIRMHPVIFLSCLLNGDKESILHR